MAFRKRRRKGRKSRGKRFKTQRLRPLRIGRRM